MGSSGRTGLDGFTDDVRRHVRLLGDRVPSYRRILEEVLAIVGSGAPEERAAGARIEAAWAGRSFLAFYDRPALLLSAVRADALAEGPAHPLFRAVAEEPPEARAVSRAAVLAALGPGRARFYAALAERRVQTNETARAVAWLWPAWLAGCDRGSRPIALCDIGASAGLNLVADRLPAIWTDPAGAPIPVAGSVRAVARVGFDAQPMDVFDAEEMAWLRACLWPGERARLERFEAAISAMRNAMGSDGAPLLVRADAAEIPARLEALASGWPADAFVLAYHTLLREYLEPATHRSYRDGMTAWLARNAPGRALWTELEIAEAEEEGPVHAVLTAHVHAGGGDVRALEIARCGYHPTSVAPEAAAVGALRGWLAPAR